MAKRILLTRRGSGPLARRFPRQCILVADTPITALVRSLSSNQAIVEASSAVSIGTNVELHHAEAGMLNGKVVSASGSRLSLAFNLGNRAMECAVQTLGRALAV
jgi:hypothetical protein